MLVWLFHTKVFGSYIYFALHMLLLVSLAVYVQVSVRVDLCILYFAHMLGPSCIFTCTCTIYVASGPLVIDVFAIALTWYQR